MTQLLIFLAGAALALMVLGHAFTPPAEKLPVREWTPVYLMDRVGQGFRALWMISQARAERFEDVRRNYAPEHERRAEDERRGREHRAEDQGQAEHGDEGFGPRRHPDDLPPDGLPPRR